MTNRWWQTAAGCIAAACLLASCGGGGGGDEVAAPDDFQVSFGRSSVTWNGPSGQAFTPEVIQVTSTGTPKDNLYVGVTTPDGNLDSNFQTPVITVDTIGRTARLSLSPRSNLLPGKYTGTLLAKVCRDIACARHYAGSPHALSYTIDVSDPPPPPPSLKVDRTQVEVKVVSGQAGTASVAVTELPQGQTSYTATVTSGEGWLSVASSAAGQFALQTASMPAGAYSGVVTVASGSDRRIVNVVYRVEPPAAGEQHFTLHTRDLTLSAVEGGAAPVARLDVTRATWNPEVTLQVTGITGQGDPSSWLTVTPRSDGDFDVLADARGKARGTYSATLLLTGPYPSTGTAVAAVNFTVGDGLAVPAPQALVVGGDTTAAQLSGSVPVKAQGANAFAWTASSDAAWLRLTRAAGTQGQDVLYEVDQAALLRLPAYEDLVANVEIRPRSSAPVAVPFTAVTGTLTLRRELPELHFVGPDVLESGKPTTVVVRGRGFDRLLHPDQRLTINGVTPLSVQRVSPTSLSVSLPALASGTRTLTMSSTLGGPTAPVALHVKDAAPRLATSMATGGAPYAQDGVVGVVHDPRRGDVYVANTAVSAVQRYREGASAWTLSTLALPALLDVGLSPDGAWLVVLEKTGKLHLVDTATFTISESHDGVGKPDMPPSLGHGLTVTNDGRVWLTIGTTWNDIYVFNLHTRTFSLVRPNVRTQFHGGPWFDVSRNGERLIAVQTASSSPSPPMLYMDASINDWRENPAGIEFFYWSQSGLSMDGGRFLALETVYDSAFARIGKTTLPDAGWYQLGAHLSPDGRRAYVIAGRFQGPSDPLRVYVFDADVAPGTTTTLPLLGMFPLNDYPMCWPEPTYSNCIRPVVNVAFDGRTLFIAGSSKMMAVPVPAPYLPAQSRRAPTMVLWREAGAR